MSGNMVLMTGFAPTRDVNSVSFEPIMGLCSYSFELLFFQGKILTLIPEQFMFCRNIQLAVFVTPEDIAFGCPGSREEIGTVILYLITVMRFKVDRVFATKCEYGAQT